MNQFMNPYLNPYGMQAQSYQPLQMNTMGQPVQVVRVNGENGARSYQLGPNSSALLLDESGLMVWLCTTDGAGYKTVSAYDITPHQTAASPDYGTLETRVQRLEEIINANATDTATVRKKSSSKSDDYAD